MNKFLRELAGFTMTAQRVMKAFQLTKKKKTRLDKINNSNAGIAKWEITVAEGQKPREILLKSMW